MGKRFAIALGSVLIALTMAVAAGGAWLLYSHSGLLWLTTRAVGFSGEGLTLDGVAGTLAAGASVQHIRFAGKDIEVRVREAYLRVSPLSLLLLRPRVSELRAAELSVASKPTEPREQPPDTLELPLNVALPDVRVSRLVVDLGEGPLEVENVSFDYSGGRSLHTLHRLSLAGYDHSVELQGTIGAHPPFPLKGAFVAKRSISPQGTLSGSARGKLTDIEVDAAGTSGEARAQGRALIQPYAKLPLAKLQAQLAGLDLRMLSKDLPRTSLEGELELTRAGVLLAGPARITNAQNGPYDKGLLPLAALRMDVRTNVTDTREFELTADLGGGGTVHGSGKLRGDAAQLALFTKSLNLAGVHSRMRQTRLAGRAELDLSKARQSIKAAISQDDIALQLVAERTGNRVDVPEFTARARGGEARGKAKVDLASEKPFGLEAGFTRFDPAAWGDFPSGSINGTFTASGSIARREAQARFTIADSRWLGAPLAARGTVNVAGERLRNAELEATLGGNRASAQGAFGAPQDTLSIRIDAPKLAVVDKRLEGTVRGTAQVSGTWALPGIRFELTGDRLAVAGRGRIESVSARGFVSAARDGAANIDASLRGIVTPEYRLARASLRVEGTRQAHTASAEARGERVDFRARARGGWRQGVGWSGTLHELVNSGEAAASLVAPVSLTVGPDRAHVQPFELRLIGGRLHVTALDYEGGRFSTAGKFSDLPVRPLVTLAGGPGGMAGTLRLSGDWSVANVPQLTGTINIARESGDVALGAERGLKLGLQSLSVNANFGREAATFQARVRSALANATAEARAAPVGPTGQARYTARSPLTFAADIHVDRLAPFAGLVDTTMLLDGEVHAKLRGTGTLGDPQITGPITAERIALALPADGVELRGGTLRAHLTQRDIRVESFSIRGGEGVFHAHGTLARTGFNEASVDWRAEQFTVLARPDRRLVVSGKGNAALSGGKLAFTGALRANEGLFELATTTLPTLGDDVVIVGRDPRAPADAAATESVAPRKVTRAVVDMSIDLGNRVQLRGRGLDVWLAGDLKVRSDSQGQLRANGVVEARRGTFAAYGQRLEIERARFFFNGPIANPGLDILAMRKRQAVEAGVAVTGSMNRPLVRVVSNPALPEGEALSWLVLGRAPEQAGAGQLSALPLATGAIMGRAGAPLAKALNVDEIGVRGGGGNAAQQFLTVGKRITERLYLAFEQSLGGTENLLRLEMSLTQRIAVRAQTGTNSSLGVFYRYAWD